MLPTTPIPNSPKGSLTPNIRDTYQQARSATPPTPAPYELEGPDDSGPMNDFAFDQEVDPALIQKLLWDQRYSTYLYRMRLVSSIAATAGISGLIFCAIEGRENPNHPTHALLTGLGTSLYFLSSLCDVRNTGDALWGRFRSNLHDGIAPAALTAVVYFAQAFGKI